MLSENMLQYRVLKDNNHKLYGRMKPRRSKIDIYCDFLMEAIKPRSKYGLILGIYINSKVGNKYFSDILKNGLIERNGTLYITTKKGFEYLKMKNDLANMLK